LDLSREQVGNYYQQYNKQNIEHEIKTYNDLNQFLSTRPMPERKEYDNLPSNYWFVLKTFNQMAKNDEGDMVSCTGFVVTCKAMIQNMVNCIGAQPSGLWTFIDGTYRYYISMFICTMKNFYLHLLIYRQQHICKYSLNIDT
jgi:hypothetical protein